jgi:transposase
VKIFFQDESRFGCMTQLAKCYAPKGMRPQVAKQMRRDYLYVYGAVCPWDGENFSLIYPNVNSITMESFLEHFSEEYKDFRNIMVMDCAGWHHDKSLKQFENIRVIKLPPYSPELNPAEHYWECLKENGFRNTHWDSIDDLLIILCRDLNKLYNDKNTVQSLSGFKWILNYS